ncbi:MAG: RNA polymerase subunit sigma-70 [Pseudomonadota bacterium]
MTKRKTLALVGATLLIHGLTACASQRFDGGMRGGGLAFVDIDIDGDGGISLPEFVKKAPSRITDPEGIFKRLDTDGDSFVSEEEFAARRMGGGRPR